MSSFIELFKINLRIAYRDKQGFFWTLGMPAVIYIVVSILPVGNFLTPNQNYSNFVLPGIIAMTIMQTGIYNLSYWLIDLKARGVLKRFLVTPIRTRDLILAILASRTVVIISELLVLTMVGALFFHAPLNLSPLSVLATLIIIIVGGSIFLLIGLLISYFANSYQAAAPITSAIGLPLAILGNIFYPIETLPHSLQILAKLLPITYMADGLRQSFLYTFDFTKIGFDILMLLIWLTILLIFTLSVFKLKED